MCVNRLNNRSRLNGNNNLGNDNNRVVGIVQLKADLLMDCTRDLWNELCSYENLLLAFKKARKHKTQKPYVIEFEQNLEHNLLLLRSELLLHSYQPKHLISFIIRDPKTRKISKSDFRDRIVHHALCNIIEPIFETSFIYDSYANRIGKGTLKAIERFDAFKRKVSRNNTIKCYILKADIKKYFENVDPQLLVGIIKKKIADKRVLWLVRKILTNYSSIFTGKGMPLGNLTSQFFANVYLNEFDQFVKHTLKARYYIRYVDDFVVMNSDKSLLNFYRNEMNKFLLTTLNLELHPDKSKIIKLGNSMTFLGIRSFYNHRLLKRSNIKKMKNRINLFRKIYEKGIIDYDNIFNLVEGWVAYAKNADTYKLRNKILTRFETYFSGEISTKEYNHTFKYIITSRFT